MTGVLLLLVLSSTVITALVNHYFFLASIVHFTEESGRPPVGSELLVASVRPLFVIIPVVFLLLAVLCLLVSHRIAGPLHRLKACMERVQNGDLGVYLKFRKGDLIHDVADRFNEMVKGIRENLESKKRS